MQVGKPESDIARNCDALAERRYSVWGRSWRNFACDTKKCVEVDPAQNRFSRCLYQNIWFIAFSGLHQSQTP